MRIDGYIDKLEVIYVDGGNQTWLDGFVKSITWSGDEQQAYRTLNVTLNNTINGDEQIVPIAVGKAVIMREDGVELFRGIIFSYDTDQYGQATITAYDEGVYLTKNHETKIFRSKTASAIIREICGQFGIPIGAIDDTGYVIPTLIMREKTLFDMIITALTMTQKQTGKRYFLYSKQGRICLSERKTLLSKWALEDGSNVINAKRSIKIDEIITQVKVVATDSKRLDSVLAIAKNDANVKAYGLIQQLEQISTTTNASMAQQRAKQLLIDKGRPKDEISMDCLGISEVIAGGAVYARQRMVNAVGGYYVTKDTHTFQDGMHKMNVTLSLTDQLPLLQYDPTIEEAKAEAKGQKAKQPKKAKAKTLKKGPRKVTKKKGGGSNVLSNINGA